MKFFFRAQLYFNTLKYLKWQQIVFQVYYRGLKKFIPLRFLVRQKGHFGMAHHLHLKPSFPNPSSYKAKSFLFLNKKKAFNNDVDWNFMGFGKLWNYNLNYFDYLHQNDGSPTDMLPLINSHCKSKDTHQFGTDPYPISLRGINWIKFFSTHHLNEPLHNETLFLQYQYLSRFPEYHLLGNHLLENGFSLLYGAYYFHNEKFYKKAKKIITNELKEQILKDGGHFELSPMYHQILLHRLLDCINLVSNNPWKTDGLLETLNTHCSRMLGWLKAVSFKNGEVPMVNDSAFGIGPTTTDLINYALTLNCKTEEVKLQDSGYRMIRVGHFELFLDVGDIGPSYIPGHAHSDTFNFILHLNGTPIIVDTGTSTYEGTSERLLERSTQSHNTVMLGGRQQSEVWGSFRVGRRAKVIQVREDANSITAVHDGYKSTLGLLHSRSWKWTRDAILVTDKILGMKKGNAAGFIHFHPSVSVSIMDNEVQAGSLLLTFKGQSNLSISSYQYAVGFGKTQSASVLRIDFSLVLDTLITVKQNSNQAFLK